MEKRVSPKETIWAVTCGVAVGEGVGVATGMAVGVREAGSSVSVAWGAVVGVLTGSVAWGRIIWGLARWQPPKVTTESMTKITTAFFISSPF
jgi:cytochrome b561